MKRLFVPVGLVIALTAGSVGWSAAATTGQVQQGGQATVSANAMPSSRIAARFTDFAGSKANAGSLVQGLESGSAITLTGAGQSTTSFTAPTGPLGNGETAISLALAQRSLAAYGIDDPSPQQLQAALVGGDITTDDGNQARLAGVLTLRASGMGWGRIARTYDVKLGRVVAGMESGRSEAQGDMDEAADGQSVAADADADGAANGADNDVDQSAAVSAQVDADDAAHARPDVDGPQVADADPARPDVDRPNVPRPDVDRPHVQRPQIERPQVERPHIQRPDIQRPQVERPDN